jgi:hypothetical protein
MESRSTHLVPSSPSSSSSSSATLSLSPHPSLKFIVAGETYRFSCLPSNLENLERVAVATDAAVIYDDEIIVDFEIQLLRKDLSSLVIFVAQKESDVELTEEQQLMQPLSAVCIIRKFRFVFFCCCFSDSLLFFLRGLLFSVS